MFLYVASADGLESAQARQQPANRKAGKPELCDRAAEGKYRHVQAGQAAQGNADAKIGAANDAMQPWTSAP
ncbi:hypothetical protein LC55x_5453 [Lysobacter capsici]|nr:hypothetical protein LC55x_5453 [Lysobacter capsici]